MKKRFSVISAFLSALLLSGCNTAAEPVVVSSAVETSMETLVVQSFPKYTYSGDDPYLKGICEYFSSLADTREDLSTNYIYIPIPVVMKTEADTDKVYVYGRFWDMWYALDGTNLRCDYGGENAGRLEMEKQDGEFKVTGFEKVRDGSYYEEDWKRLCGNDQELYNSFFTKEEQEDRRDDIRKELILQYAADNGMNIESYQDTGWEPVLLSE